MSGSSFWMVVMGLLMVCDGSVSDSVAVLWLFCGDLPLNACIIVEELSNICKRFSLVRELSVSSMA